MAVCVWNLCKRCARTPLKGTCFAITRNIAQCTSRASRAFLSLRSSWLPLTCTMISCLLSQTLIRASLMKRKRCSAGAWRGVNCLKIERAATVAKKNTPICRRSVRCKAEYSLKGSLVIPTVARLAKLVNHFAVRYCYV